MLFAERIEKSRERLIGGILLRFFQSELEHAVSFYKFNSVRASKEGYP